MARALGCTDGQVWTLGIVVALAVVLVPATLPAGLRPRGDTVLVPTPAAPSGRGPLVVALPAPTPAPTAAPPDLPSVGVLPPLPLPAAAIPPPLAAAPAPRPGRAGPASAPPAPGRVVPLAVTDSGWYDADAEAPARQQLTPPGELPVSSDRGTRAATAVLRLSGNSPRLVLAADTTPGRTTGTAVLELCRNATSRWRGADAEPPSAAPGVSDSCVRGTVAGDRWTFLLTDIGPPDATTGFTLRAVVTSSPTETFAVTFFRELPS